MQQKKIDQLTKESSEHKERIASIEVSLDNIKPLVSKLDSVVDSINKLAISLAENTISHNNAVKMAERGVRRMDKLEDQTLNNTNEIAAARPAIKTMNDLSKKMMYFGFFMVALSIAVVAYMVKG